MPLLQTLNQAKQTLQKAGIENPFLDAELLLAHALGKSREFVIGYPEYELTNAQQELFDKLIKRRENFEPVAKIIGIKEFWGRDFAVSGATLDPRPDSEALIEAILEVIPDRKAPLKVLDLGVGSGCLLLTILAEYPAATGLGVDISADTLEMAKINAQKLGLAKRSSFILNDLAKGLDGKFDLIISNPPYIKKSHIEKLKPEVSIFEPMLALDGGEDGLDCYRKLANQIQNLLKKNTYIVFEFGQGQEQEIIEIFNLPFIRFISLKNDLAGIARCVVFQEG